MYKTFIKGVVASMLGLVLVVGVFGFVSPSTAHAVSDSTLEEQSVSELRATLIALIRQLLEVLTNQYLAAGGSLDKLKHDESEDKDGEDDSCDEAGELEIEADIFTNETVVSVKIDGDEEIFVTDADTEAEIVDAVLDEFGTLTRSEVEGAIDIEEEDRASRESDKTEKDSVNSCDDEDEDDEVEDEDEDGDDDVDDDDESDDEEEDD